MTEVLRLPFALALLLYQSIVLALSQIWANKIRGILTTLGILIGVAAVSAVITLITGMKQRVLSEFEALGTNKIFIEPRFPRVGAGRNVSWRQIMFRLSDFDDLLEHCPSVERYTHVMQDREPVTFGRNTDDREADVFAVDPEWHEIEKRYVKTGRLLSVLDVQQRRPVCLINEVLRDKLQMDRDPVGQYLDVEGNRMMVIGLLEPPATSMGMQAEMREVVIPFTYAAARDRWPWYMVIAASRSPERSEDAKAEIEFYLRQKRGVKPGKPDTFEVQTAQRMLEQFGRVAAMVTLIATGIVGISLLVGGVGIMNIMLVSVSERTREIGLRKAVGARPGAILLQFLVEAVVLCLVGGAIGLAAGQGITSLVARFLPPEMKGAPMFLPASAVLLAFTFSAVVGLIFGMFPAIKAARLDPIEALRHE